MSFPLSVKHPLLQKDFLKTESKGHNKHKKIPGIILTPELPKTHVHPDLLGRARLKLKLPSAELLFKDKPSPTYLLFKNEGNFYMSRKQATDFFATNELLQQVQAKYKENSIQQDFSAQKDSKSHFIMNETNNYSASQGISEEMKLQKQLLDEMAKGIKTDRTAKTYREGDSALTGGMAALSKISKINKKSRKYEPIILPKLGFMSNFSVHSPREIHHSNSTGNIVDDMLSPKMSMRTYEFIAIQKRKLLGNDYTRLQKIQSLLERQKKEEAEDKKPKPKLNNITLELLSDPSARSETERHLEENQNEKKRMLQHEVDMISKGLTSLNYDSLRDEYKLEEAPLQKDISSLNLPIIENKYNFNTHNPGNEYGITPYNRHRSNFEKYIQSLSSPREDRAKSLAFDENNLVNEVEIAKIQERYKEKINQEYASLKNAIHQNYEKKSPDKKGAADVITTELEDLNQKMKLAKRGNRRLKKQFRRNKRSLTKNFNNLDKKLDKVHLLIF